MNTTRNCVTWPDSASAAAGPRRTVLEATRAVGVSPARALVVEDALAGVEAGRAGGFALVITLARQANARSLRDAGADVVVGDLEELLS